LTSLFHPGIIILPGYKNIEAGMVEFRTSGCTAFMGTKAIASGDLRDVALKAKSTIDRDRWAQVLIFDDVTSALVQVDFRGSAADVLRRIDDQAASATHASEPPQTGGETRRPGRPKLGVVAREVTLLPRHWDWLASQPGGASVALRKLVEQGKRANQGTDRKRRAQESAYRFLSAMAGNEPGFEEALRSLFAGKRKQFDQIVEPWPIDVREHAKKLAAVAFQGSDG
jgi:uncharacterized protein